MGRRAAVELVLTDAEREALVALTQAGEPAQALAMRARIILECSAGLANKVVAAKHHVAQQTVGKWRARYIEHRLDGLLDAPRTGAPRTIKDSQVQAVIAKTRESLLQGAPHQTSRTLAQELGVSQATVLRIWRNSGLQPHRREITQRYSDPEFGENLHPIGGGKSADGIHPPTSTTSACETATPAFRRLDLETKTSQTIEDLEKKSTDEARRRAKGQGVSKIPKQAGRSHPPTRKINDKHLAAVGDSMTIIPGPRGRKTGEWRALSAQESQKLFKTVCDERPDGVHLNLGHPLWNVSAASRLVHQDCGLSLARSTVARYLERWGIVAEHPFEVGLGKRPSTFTQWAYSAYPKIEFRAKTERGDIYWFFDDDIHPEEIPYPDSPPEIDRALSGSHRLLSVIQGQLRCAEMQHLGLLTHWKSLSWMEMPTPFALKTSSSWLILQDRDPTERMQKLLKALVRLSETSGRKVFLFAPEDTISSTAKLSPWLASVSAHIEVFTLPPLQTVPKQADTTL